MRRQIKLGFSARQATALFKEKRLGLEEAFDLDVVWSTLLDLLLTRERGKAEALLERAILGHGAEAVCVKAVQPLLARVGEMWRRGEITVADEHWVSQSLKSVLIRFLAEESHATQDGVRAVVACAPEELHEIGALMIALFLARRGLDILYLGQAVPLADLYSFVDESGAETIFLSVAQKKQAEQMLTRLPEFEGANGIRVFLGGLAFENYTLRRAAGNRFLNSDAQEAVSAVVNLLAE
jgi:MerR family transcriptional regulator, light-induced transcriptional regulator